MTGVRASAAFGLGSGRGVAVNLDSTTIRSFNGGAIDAESPLTMVNSTITGNANRGSTIRLAPLSGGGMPPASTIVASTIADNGVDATASALGSSVPLFMAGSIVASNTGAATCASPITSFGFNLIGDSSCHATSPGDVQNVDPKLASLQPINSVPPPPSRPPLAGSPAVDRIPVGTTRLCSAGAVDQAGTARPVGSACDVGAIEGVTPFP
jgi:hypothetical protein